MFLALVLLAIGFGVYVLNKPEPIAPVVPKPPSGAAPPVGTEFARRVAFLAAPERADKGATPGEIEYRADWPAIAAYTAFILGPLAWWLLVWLRRRGFLERLPSGGEVTVKKIAASATPALPAYGRDLRYLSREMRRRRTVPARTLDIKASLAATLRLGGMPQLVFGSHVEPDYLILVDRANAADHQAHLADEVIAILSGQGISMEQYEFEGDPRYCRHAPPGQRRLHQGPQSLEQLLSRHAECRLIVFSDGYGMFDRYTGRPFSWVHKLFDWPSTVLVTPVPHCLWGMREWLLTQEGLSLLPLDGGGMHALGDLYRQDVPCPEAGAQAMERTRPVYLRDADILLDTLPRPAAALRELLDALAADLGEDGMAWLAGCAVYPEVHWGLTLAVGDGILGERKVGGRGRRDVHYAQLLAQLARLPWMRHGFMPDWFRSGLLQRLSPQHEQAVRRQLDRYFAALCAGPARPDGQSALQVVLPAPSYWRDMLAGWRALLQRRPVPTMREERIFLKFMSAPRRLAFGASDVLMRLFYRKGAPLAGPRVLPLLFFLALTGLLMTQRPPVQLIRHMIVDTPVDPIPRVLALSDDGSRLATADDQGGVRAIAVGAAAVETERPVSCSTDQRAGLAIAPFGAGAVYTTASGGRAQSASVSPACKLDSPKPLIVRSASAYHAGTLLTEPAAAKADAPGATLCRIVTPDSVTLIGRAFLQSALLAGRASADSCSVSGDGSRLAVASSDGVLREFTLNGPQNGFVDRKVALPQGGALVALASNRDASVIAALQLSGQVLILRAGRVTWTALGEIGAKEPLALAGDGSTIAFATSGREIDILRLEPPKGRNVLLSLDDKGETFGFGAGFNGDLAGIAETLRERYGYTSPSAAATLNEEDRVTILVNDPTQAALAAFGSGSLAGALPREILAILVLKKEKPSQYTSSATTAPDQQANQLHARWMLRVSPGDVRTLDNQLRQMPGPMSGSAIAQAITADSGASSDLDKPWYGPWRKAGHAAGDIILVPTGPLLKPRPATEAAPPEVLPLPLPSGMWTGDYSYIGEVKPGIPKRVEFQVRVNARGESFSGQMSEPNTFGDASSPTLYARVEGTIEGKLVRFRKTYDGTGGERHSIDYVGFLNRSTNTIKGKWNTDTTRGNFLIRLPNSPAMAR